MPYEYQFIDAFAYIMFHKRRFYVVCTCPKCPELRQRIDDSLPHKNMVDAYDALINHVGEHGEFPCPLSDSDDGDCLPMQE